MTVIFENEYMRLNSYEDFNTLEQEFLPASEELFDKFYIEQMIIFLDAVKRLKPAQLMINVLNGGPTMNPEVQNWMQNTLYKELILCGVKRKAYLLGEELVARLSIKQTAEEDPNQDFDYAYFSDRNKAIDWLLAYSSVEHNNL